MPVPTERPEQPLMDPSVPVYVPSAGQMMQGAFLSYAMQHPEVGDPVSAMIERDGWLVQWFTYARLELPPEANRSDSSAVTLALIGSEVHASTGYMRQLPAFRAVAQRGDFYVPETGHSINGSMLEAYRLPGNNVLLGLPLSEEFTIGSVTWQMFERGALTWEDGIGVIQQPLGVTNAAMHGVSTAPLEQPFGVLTYSPDDPLLMSDAFAGERWIEVDLSTFTLTAWVGDYPVLETLVVTGSQFSPTVIGEHSIYLKNEVQTLSGIGWSGEPYLEEDVPDVMYFWTDFAIHGTTWRTSYGYSDSQGCVIPPNDVADFLFEWADFGTRVSVHE